jgi:glycerol-3-phosphate dehydrogenase
MNLLRIEMFRAARAYHAAVAAYCRVLGNREDLEDAAQLVLGASLRYRIAIDGVIASTPGDACNHRRLHALRAQLDCLSRQYNIMKRAKRPKPEGHAALWA